MLQLPFNHLSDVLQSRRFALHFPGELIAEFFHVNLAHVEKFRVHLVVARFLGADGIIDNPVQFLEQVRHIRRVAPFFQLLVNRLDVIVTHGMLERRGLHD